MSSKIAIYLAGSIKKGHENPNETFWTDEDITFLKEQLTAYEVAFLNPAFRLDDLSNSHSVFGRDMLQVFCSHVVFVDARDRRGLGVGAEMMWAKLNKIPVVAWAPKDSHYHKSQTTVLNVTINDFIHPFIDALSDKIVENLQEGAQWIKKFMEEPTNLKIKGIEHMNVAMDYYKENQLHKDDPMQQLLTLDDELSKRLHRPGPSLLETEKMAYSG